MMVIKIKTIKKNKKNSDGSVRKKYIYNNNNNDGSGRGQAGDWVIDIPPFKTTQDVAVYYSSNSKYVCAILFPSLVHGMSGKRNEVRCG